jgi:hypothetical protein
MGSRRVNTVILCEDLQQAVFVRRFLIGAGRAEPRAIAIKHCPKGRGCGFQHVLENFPTEVKAFRSKSSYLTLCLIVVIDADNCSVEQRICQLDDCLRSTGQSLRTDEERIVILIPKRNIESWIYYLMGQEVDETTTYNKLTQETDCLPAVRRLVEWFRSDIPIEAPDSLKRAYGERQRCNV